jgi:hypothetical protein
MPSSYTPSLKLLLQGTGENSGTWGDKVNTDLTSLVDTAVAGYISITLSSTSYTLSSGNGSLANESRYMCINFTGAPGAAATVI